MNQEREREGERKRERGREKRGGQRKRERMIEPDVIIRDTIIVLCDYVLRH